jgi:hypothetical protein
MAVSVPIIKLTRLTARSMFNRGPAENARLNFLSN